MKWFNKKNYFMINGFPYIYAFSLTIKSAKHASILQWAIGELLEANCIEEFCHFNFKIL